MSPYQDPNLGLWFRRSVGGRKWIPIASRCLQRRRPLLSAATLPLCHCDMRIGSADALPLLQALLPMDTFFLVVHVANVVLTDLLICYWAYGGHPRDVQY